MDIRTSGKKLNTHSEQLALSRDALTHDHSIQLFVSQIAVLVAIPTPHFQALYFSTIASYLSMTQHCPREIIHTRLQAVTDGLKLRRSLVLPFDASPELASEEHDRWTYAVFISLLMYNLAPEILGYEVVMQKNEGDPFTRWHPLINSLEPPNRFKVVGELSTSIYSSLLLMPVIINAIGLQWLNENNRVFNTVLDLIISPDPSNRLGALVYQANHLKEHFTSEAPCLQATPATSETKPTTVVTKKSSPLQSHNQIGRNFRRWLVAEIGTGNNNQHIIAMASGVALIYPEIFQQYAKDHGSLDWELVEAEFLQLNLHTVNSLNQSPIHNVQVPKLGKREAMLINAIKKS